MSFMSRNAALLAAVLVSGTAMAGDVQQVSCTDSGCGQATCGTEGCNTKTKRCKNDCDRCRSGQGQCDQCNHCDSGAGKCSMRDRADAFALDWASKCGPIGRRAAKGRPLAQKLHWHCTTKAAPDSGWAPPATMPLTRASHGYTAYNNYGMGGYAPAAPMVYMPTDTTQLGYSYAHVPQWRPNPGMIPSVPQPSNFHARFCPGQCTGTPCMGGQMMGTEVYSTPMSGSCDSCMHMSQSTQPMPAKPLVQAPAPAAVRTAQAQSTMKPQLRQVSQQQTVRPTNQRTQQRTQQRVKATTNYRRSQQQKSGGWLGLPSLRDMKF